MESRIEELEVELRIATAKADLAIRLVRYLSDELGRSGVISWGADELFRQFHNEIDFNSPDEEIARLAIIPAPEEATAAEGAMGVEYIMRTASRCRREIRDQIKHERSSLS